MRAAIAAIACVFLPAVVATAQEPVGVAGNVLTRYLDRANIHPPVRVAGLTVFPISLSREQPLGGVLTMSEALKKSLLAVAELDPPRVNRARFINKSDRLVFLMAGEVLTGGKQNRTLATDALLGPDSAVELPLYCVQRGRWRGKRKFAAQVGVAPQSVRNLAAGGAAQQEVWAEVARTNRRLGRVTPSDDLAAALSAPENARRLAELRGRILPKLPAGCAGVVVARGGVIVGADLFNCADLFARMRDKVLDSYLAQYSLKADAGKKTTKGTGPGTGAVRAYLVACYRAEFKPGPVRGVGRVYHVRGARYGQTLGYAPKAAAPEVPLVRREYMVHTALSERIVPVKPTPRPPIPPLPRPLPRLRRPRIPIPQPPPGR